MYTANGRAGGGAVKAYQTLAAKDVEDANPHRLIQLLMGGALDRIAAARGFMERGRVAEKGARISSAISIIDCLRVSLDREAGGQISTNLEALYTHMMLRLAEGNARNDPAALDEVAALLREIKSAWDQLPAEAAARHAPETVRR